MNKNKLEELKQKKVVKYIKKHGLAIAIFFISVICLILSVCVPNGYSNLFTVISSVFGVVVSYIISKQADKFENAAKMAKRNQAYSEFYDYYKTASNYYNEILSKNNAHELKIFVINQISTYSANVLNKTNSAANIINYCEQQRMFYTSYLNRFLILKYGFEPLIAMYSLIKSIDDFYYEYIKYISSAVKDNADNSIILDNLSEKVKELQQLEINLKTETKKLISQTYRMTCKFSEPNLTNQAFFELYYQNNQIKKDIDRKINCQIEADKMTTDE